jgi:trk system potassium uptake protein TrkA
MIARVGRERFGIEKVVARIYDPKRAEIYERLGVATVATVKWTAERVLRRIMTDRPAVEWVDPSAALSIIERMAPDAWVAERVERLSEGVGRVVAVRRYGQALIADHDTLVQQGDVLYVAVLTSDIEMFDRVLAEGPKGD